MSVVHNYLSRPEDDPERAPETAVAAPAQDVSAKDVSQFDLEVQRKEALLAQGIRQLEVRIQELTEELRHTRGELQKAREENLRWRQGTIGDRWADPPRPNRPEPSLLSRALE